MEGQPIYSYVFFGTGWRFLQDVRENMQIHGDGWVLENIERVFDGIKKFQLNVTTRAAYELENFKKEIQGTPQNALLTAEQATNLSTIMRNLRRTLDAETRGKYAYIVTDKRMDINKLLDRPKELFPPDVFEKLPELAKYDFSEAGKCIAFERPTAAAFHLLRGTESVLRWFYCNVVKRGRSELMWGPMTEALRKRRTPPPIELLQNLDNLRRLFRNPTQHPDKIYDIQEVQDLFGLCVDVVNRMVRWKPQK